MSHQVSLWAHWRLRLSDFRSGSNPDHLFRGRMSASAECGHGSAKAVRWSSCAMLLSAPLPKFVIHRSPPDTNFGSKGHVQVYASSAAFDWKFLYERAAGVAGTSNRRH